MKQFIIRVFTVLAVAFGSNAYAAADQATQYATCEAAVKANKAPFYQPSFLDHRGPKVADDEHIVTLEAPMCVYMHVVGGWKVVPIAAGEKLTFPKNSNEPVRHPKCNNAIKGGRYVGELPTSGGSSGAALRPATYLPAMPVVAEEGRVYLDALGNTFERHQGGSRLCKFFVNGVLTKQQFVQHPDPVESKKQCDLLSQEFYASLTPTTQEQTVVSYAKPATGTTVAQQDGDHTCDLKFNGQVVETTKTVNDAACKAWTDAKAKAKGWIPK